MEGAALLSDSAVDIVELNISCPNVKVGGMAYGVKAESAGAVVRMVRDACKSPLIKSSWAPRPRYPGDVQGCGAVLSRCRTPSA